MPGVCPVTAGGVLPKRAPLTKDAAKSAVSLALARLTHAHGMGAVADQAGCSARTLAEAKAEHSLPELHTLLNLLPLDPSALDELLAPMGLKVVPVEAGGLDWQGVSANMAGFLAALLDALRDGRVDHRERATLMNQARPMVQELTAAIAQHDRERAAA
jgi:hypothetical protein